MSIAVVCGIVVLIVRFLRKSPDLTIQAVHLENQEWVEDEDVFASMYDALSQARRHSKDIVAFLEAHVDFPYYLPDAIKEFIAVGTLKRVTGPDADDFKLRVGPVEVGRLELYWRRLTNRKSLQLRVSSQSDSHNIGDFHLSFCLTAEGRIWYSRKFTSSLAGAETVFQEAAQEVVWVLAHGISRKTSTACWETPPGVSMLRGISLIVSYIGEPDSIKPLEKARECFREAARAGSPWDFRAGLAEVIALRLSQSCPAETVDQMLQLQSKYSVDRRKQTILTYNLGVARFYQYTTASYEEALALLDSVKRPYQLIWRRTRPLWLLLLRLRKSSRQQYLLHCLAQANIAVTLAHMINPDREQSENESLAERVRAIVNAVSREIETTQATLGSAAVEMEWLALNAQVMVALNLRVRLAEGLEAAREALRIAPYALDVKANLGSLNLLLATRAAESGQDPTQTCEFQEACRVFEELSKVGWDPGFVQYRLGTIRRIQGRFEDALASLKAAGDPKIQDVPSTRIGTQVRKAELKDKTLRSDDV